METNQHFVYVGFSKRAAAAIIDALIGMALLPVVYPVIFYSYNQKTMIPELLITVVWTVFWMWLVVRFGATPGKMVIKARIVNAEGKYLDWYHAFLRILFPGMLMTINSHLQSRHIMNSMPPDISVNTFLELGNLINEYGYPFFVIGTCLSLSVYVDVFAVLFNKKKRAIHDFIAGSYVITKDSIIR